MGICKHAFERAAWKVPSGIPPLTGGRFPLKSGALRSGAEIDGGAEAELTAPPAHPGVPPHICGLLLRKCCFHLRDVLLDIKGDYSEMLGFRKK